VRDYRRHLVVSWVAIVLVLPAQGRGDPASNAATERPWAIGVSEAEQKTAFELFDNGNREFAESHTAQALQSYREAIQHWDHPSIRYNIAVCLIDLNQPLEADENLERSLAFGESALPAAQYREALRYQKLLAAQLARIAITAQQPGMEITLDGKLLFTAPGSVDRKLLPGEHEIVASSAGFSTRSRRLVLVAGKSTAYHVDGLEPVSIPTLESRRWPVWIPWSVLAAAGVAVAGGTWSYASASHNFDNYNRVIASRCTQRCTPEMLAGFADLHRYEHRGDVEEVVAISLFVAGGVALATGVAGLVLNQPRLAHAPRPTVEATATGITAGLAWGF